MKQVLIDPNPAETRPSQTRFPLAHTYSIVACDRSTGSLGVAVQSHWFSVGAVVPWAEAGIGAVATQSMTEISYGPLGLELLHAGKTPQQALSALLTMDEGRELRQVAMIDAQGRTATHTGSRCIAAAGHETGEDFSVQANMMLRASVWPAMAEAYRQTSGDLSQRMLAALRAAQNEAGDIRGSQSAAIIVVSGDKSAPSWTHHRMELRVEDHPNPIGELERLVRIWQAYELMNLGDQRLAAGDTPAALLAYRQAAALYPQNPELPFWHAVTLVDMGQIAEALPIFRQVFAADPNWYELLTRLPAAGLLKADAAILQQIQAVLAT